MNRYDNWTFIGHTADRRTTGWVIPFFAITLTVLLTFIALAIDIGVAFYEQRRLHMATDAGALAAAELLPTSDSAVLTEVRTLAQANGAIASEIKGIVCGVWSNGSFSARGGCSQSGVNALQVSGRRAVSAIFARAIGVGSLRPTVVSTAVRQGGSNCVRPIGLEQVYIEQFSPGNLFVIDRLTPGNWGKLDIDGNMSSGANFETAMLTNRCSSQVSANQNVSTGTGFGGSMSHVLSDVIQQQRHLGMVLPVTTAFPSHGNGNVTLLSFAKVDLVYQQGSGQQWQATLRLVEYPTIPPTDVSGGGARKLVM